MPALSSKRLKSSKTAKYIDCSGICYLYDDLYTWTVYNTIIIYKNICYLDICLRGGPAERGGPERLGLFSLIYKKIFTKNIYCIDV